MVPSLILETDEDKNYGAIFLGGFKAAINPEFLKKENVTHVLNVAGKGLGILFGPKYRVSYCMLLEKKQARKIYLFTVCRLLL